MSWIRSRDRRTAQRLAVVGGYRFPAGVRHRFTVAHGDLDTAAVALVEDAARQWFRLAVRHPRAGLSMPSVVVGDLWRELVRDTRDYAEFCAAAFGRPWPRPPESDNDRPARLAATFRWAQQDESCPPEALPLLFRVDREMDVEGGGHYLADCGGRGVCHELPGAICLRHVAGVRSTRRWPGRLGNASLPPGAGTGGDLGGGFGP
jgi:hypothetical protein